MSICYSHESRIGGDERAHVPSVLDLSSADVPLSNCRRRKDMDGIPHLAHVRAVHSKVSLQQAQQTTIHNIRRVTHSANFCEKQYHCAGVSAG